jgi:hypothetical protein
MKKNSPTFLFQDIAIIVFSALIAIILVKTDILGKILTSTHEMEFLGSFISGIFFTSVFTTTLSIATFSEIARTGSIWGMAFFGALGSIVGDLIIFRFVRDRFSEHMRELFQHRKGKHRLTHLFKLRSFRWISFLIGGIIIASPFPDELGISLLGFSKLRLRYFIPLSFVFNFIGILVIGGIGRLFS